MLEPSDRGVMMGAAERADQGSIAQTTSDLDRANAC